MQDVLSQLQDAGLEIDHFDVGAFRRCRVVGDKGGKKSGWYVLHELRLDNGQAVVVGACGNWKRYGDETIKITFDAKALSQGERERLAIEQQRLREKADAERLEREAAARERACRMWPRLRTEGTSEYLSRKKVRAFGIRFLKGSIVVPVRAGKDVLVGLQFIDADGTKRFLTGTPKRGAFHVIGRHDPLAPVVFVEGYATGASVHMATGLQVVVCFDAGNLEPVVAVFREQLPEQAFIVAADNDSQTFSNPGIAKAREAAQKHRAQIVWPVSPSGDSGKKSRSTPLTKAAQGKRLRVAANGDK